MFRRCLVVFLVVLGGCSSRPSDMSGIIDRPADFYVDAVVYASRVPAESVAALPRAARPARYIVDTDGTLRTAIGPGSNMDTLPPATRRLSAVQMDGLWRLVRDSGLFAADSPMLIEAGESYAPLPGRSTGVIAVFADGSRRTAAGRVSEGGAMFAVLDRLAIMSWLPE